MHKFAIIDGCYVYSHSVHVFMGLVYSRSRPFSFLFCLCQSLTDLFVCIFDHHPLGSDSKPFIKKALTSNILSSFFHLIVHFDHLAQLDLPYIFKSQSLQKAHSDTILQHRLRHPPPLHFDLHSTSTHHESFSRTLRICKTTTQTPSTVRRATATSVSIAKGTKGVKGFIVTAAYHSHNFHMGYPCLTSVSPCPVHLLALLLKVLEAQVPPIVTSDLLSHRGYQEMVPATIQGPTRESLTTREPADQIKDPITASNPHWNLLQLSLSCRRHSPFHQQHHEATLDTLVTPRLHHFSKPRHHHLHH